MAMTLAQRIAPIHAAAETATKFREEMTYGLALACNKGSRSGAAEMLKAESSPPRG
jgi:hypothetical protein